MTRRFWVLVHRYAGLYLAGVLIVAGLTGSILAFDAQISRWLNPGLMQVPVQARPMLDPFTLRERALAIEPRARINFVPLNNHPGEVYYFGLEPRLDPASGRPFDLGYEGLYLNPYTGEEMGREKDIGLWPVNRKNFTRFVFALHYSLAAGETGRWLFGLAALVWTVDCFVGFFLTWPRRQPARVGAVPAVSPVRKAWLARWLPSWRFVWRGRPYRINFNLHRATGLWTWVLLFIFATSSVCFNLPEVYGPVMNRVFLMPDVRGSLPDLPQPAPDPGLDWREAAIIGERLTAQQATLHGFKPRPAHGTVWFYYDPVKGLFSYPAHSDLDVGYHYAGTTVFFDGKTGEFRGIQFASGHNAAATFTTWVSGIHNCTIGGFPMQIVVSLTGLVVAMLSGTGVYLWWRKRRTVGPVPPARGATLSS